MRLTGRQLDLIRETVSGAVSPDALCELVLFGSRLNDDARGGDVDLYLRTTGLDAAERGALQRRLRPLLEEALDLPVDLVVEDHRAPASLLSRTVRERGLRLLPAPPSTSERIST